MLGDRTSAGLDGRDEKLLLEVRNDERQPDDLRHAYPRQSRQTGDVLGRNCPLHPDPEAPPPLQREVKDELGSVKAEVRTAVDLRNTADRPPLESQQQLAGEAIPRRPLASGLEVAPS